MPYMSLFVISDLHLAITNNGKSMEAFGTRWKDYVQRLEKNWRAVVSDTDTVVLPGDISWAMTLDEAQDDFAFLNALPGQKIIGKGNHDFYWTTATKMHQFFDRNGFDSLHLLYNNAHRVENFIVCGTRGWFNDEKLQHTVGEVDYQKIVNREVLRLRMSLDAAVRLKTQASDACEIIPFLHFPPIWADFRCNEIIDTLKEYGIKRCYFGHIHGNDPQFPYMETEGIRFHLVSADHLRFTPLAVFEQKSTQNR